MLVNEVVLSVEGIEKRIGKRILVEDLTFSIRAGEVFGFLGPNGAGKTTTIRMLVGLIRPTKGRIKIAGYDLKRQFREAMRQVGSIVENPESYAYLTGWENLLQAGRMLGGVEEAWMHEVVDWVGLKDRIHDRVKTYSLGMKQRLGIALALLSKPRLLILDEPTNGLDPAGIRELRGFIRRLVEHKKMALLISSHLLSEVEMLCDRIGIIQHGRLIRVATTKELLEETSHRYLLRLFPPEKGEEILRHSPDVVEVRREGEKLLCRIPDEKVAGVIALMVQEGVAVHEASPIHVTLEDLFLMITGGEAGA